MTTASWDEEDAKEDSVTVVTVVSIFPSSLTISLAASCCHGDMMGTSAPRHRTAEQRHASESYNIKYSIKIHSRDYIKMNK